jgi:Immunoglobulin I-set domain
MRIRSSLALMALLLAACGGGSPGNSTPGGSTTPPGTSAPAITTQPGSQNVTVGQTATFSVVATGTAPLSYEWQRNGTAIAAATASSYTTAATTLADNGATFKVTVTNSIGTITSVAATLTVSAAATAGVDVLTYHNDNSRSGQNLSETILTLANVNSTQFGLLRVLPADGLVDGQPLIASNLSVSGAMRNVVYVVTENDSVYSYDADTGAALVHVSLLGSGETPSDDHGCGQVTPQIGITSTPVIDRSSGPNGTIYVVAMSKNAAGDYLQRLHALDLLTLAERPNSPVVVQATYPGTANNSVGTTSFEPGQYEERAGLLLLNGTVYTAWTSHCDQNPYNGWLIGYDESTLAQSQVLNITPNGSEGAIWQSGGGMAADSAGNIYALVANGTFDTTLDAAGFPIQGDYGNAFIKLSSATTLQVTDYFDMDNTVAESNGDVDLGSGGPMLLPDQTDSTGVVRQLAVGAGKDGHLYVVNRSNMGKFSMSNNAIWEDMPGALPGGVWATPAYFQGTVYYGDVGGTLKAFAIQQAMLGKTPMSQTSVSFGYPGTAPAVSANGSSDGIVWAVQNSSPAVLHAFAAGSLATELYNSSQAANGRDQFGAGNKFITPSIVNGKVYVGTPTGVAVFGLL